MVYSIIENINSNTFKYNIECDAVRASRSFFPMLRVTNYPCSNTIFLEHFNGLYLHHLQKF